MAFRKALPFHYPKLADQTEGDVLAEGVYCKTSENKFGGTNHHFRCEGQGRMVILSSGHLNWLLQEHADIGDMCRVTYLGTETLDRGKFAGKQSHQFELEIDPDQREAPAAVAAANAVQDTPAEDPGMLEL